MRGREEGRGRMGGREEGEGGRGGKGEHIGYKSCGLEIQCWYGEWENKTSNSDKVSRAHPLYT
jgi:hypothetical protein